MQSRPQPVAIALAGDGSLALAPKWSSIALRVQSRDPSWQDRMMARRLRVYGPPCPSIGFGACDVGFAELFLKNRANPFPLSRRPASTDWYVDIENLP